MKEERFVINDWLMYDTEKSEDKTFQFITTKQAVILLNDFVEKNKELKRQNNDLKETLRKINIMSNYMGD